MSISASPGVVSEPDQTYKDGRGSEIGFGRPS